MYVIAIIGQKGGTGKTTVAVALAVQAAKVGQTVIVIDTDPQANAANWKDRRKADDMVVLATPAARLAPTLEAARKSGADLAIIDTPRQKRQRRSRGCARLRHRVYPLSGPPVRHGDIDRCARPVARRGQPAGFRAVRWDSPGSHEERHRSQSADDRALRPAVLPCASVPPRELRRRPRQWRGTAGNRHQQSCRRDRKPLPLRHERWKIP